VPLGLSLMLICTNLSGPLRLGSAVMRGTYHVFNCMQVLSVIMRHNIALTGSLDFTKAAEEHEGG